jgi:hypothetical protein
VGSRWDLVDGLAAALATITAGAVGAGPHAYTYTLSAAAILYGESEEPPPSGEPAYLALGSPRETEAPAGLLGADNWNLFIPVRGWVAPTADTAAKRYRGVLDLFEDLEFCVQSRRLTLGGTGLDDALPIDSPAVLLLSSQVLREARAWGRFDALVTIPYRRWRVPPVSA